jgi:hypothetical protein
MHQVSLRVLKIIKDFIEKSKLSGLGVGGVDEGRRRRERLYSSLRHGPRPLGLPSLRLANSPKLPNLHSLDSLTITVPEAKSGMPIAHASAK